MIVTIKGKWVSGNRFLAEDGEEIKVIPYTYIDLKYRSLLPIDCYINIILPKNIICAVFIIEN